MIGVVELFTDAAADDDDDGGGGRGEFAVDGAPDLRESRPIWSCNLDLIVSIGWAKAALSPTGRDQQGRSMSCSTITCQSDDERLTWRIRQTSL